MGKKAVAKQSGARSQKSGDPVKNSVLEQRIDPADGHRLTWGELRKKYAKQYSASQVSHYWYNECKRLPKAAAKANVKTPTPQPQDVPTKGARPLASQLGQDKEQAEQEVAAKTKTEDAAAAKAAKAEDEAAAAAKVKAEEEAMAEEMAKAAAKAREETAAKAAKEAAAKVKAEAVEAAAKVKAEEEAVKAAKEAAAKAEKELEAKATEQPAPEPKSEIAPQEDLKSKEPLLSAFMVWLGDLTNKFCKGSCTGTQPKKEIVLETPQCSLPEQLVGA
jgi:colicin import membrane protein